MYLIDKEKTKQILVSELDYRPYQADTYLENFPPIHDELEGAVISWLADRSFPDIQIKGVALSEVMRLRKCHFLLAVEELNKLLNKDLTPDQVDLLVRTLRKPVVYR